jgi:hypothetical protein
MAAAGEFLLDKNCNSFMVENTGDTVAIVEGKRLLAMPGAGVAGQSFSVSGNAGEKYTGRLRVEFATPAGANPQVEITQKFFIPEKK